MSFEFGVAVTVIYEPVMADGLNEFIVIIPLTVSTVPAFSTVIIF